MSLGAGIPDGTGFATKPHQSVAMLARAHDAGGLTGWVAVTADEAYGQNPTFRAWLAERGVPYVLATRNDDVLTSPDGHRRQAKAPRHPSPDAAVGGSGARSGPARTATGSMTGSRLPSIPPGCHRGWGHWLLVRRQTEASPGKTRSELAFYRCAGPARTPLRELIRVAGARWAIEECIQTAKNEAGLDQYQVRDWRAWHAHTTLAMLAAAYLAATRAREAERGPDASRDGLIPLSGNEIRRLVAAPVLAPVACMTSVITWSNWRRGQQH